MGEVLVGKPGAMPPTPRFAAVAAIIFEQKALNALPGFSNVERSGLPGTHQIAHSLVSFVRNPNETQFSGPQQPCQRHGITVIVLDAVTRFAWNDGRRRDATDL